MLTKSAKAKARRLQDRLVREIVATFPVLVPGTADGDTPCDIRPARMSEAGMDIKLTTERAREVFPFAVEAKNREAINIWEAIKQAEGYTGDRLMPAVAISRNNLPEPYIAVPLSHFLRIVASSTTLHPPRQDT